MADKCAGWIDGDGNFHDCRFADEAADHRFVLKSYCRFHLPMGERGEGGKTDWDDDRKEAISNTIVERIEADAARPKDERGFLDFRGAVVPGTLDLDDHTIGWIDFSWAEIHGLALFSRVQFHREASFEGTQFHGETWFDEAQFDRDASFAGNVDTARKEARAFNTVSFQDTHFGGDANFSNREFRGYTDFAGAIFKRAPNFHGSTLHQDTAFGGIDCFPDVTSDGADRAYRTLRQAMEQNRARVEEGMFYALEQKARRHLMKRFDPAFLTSLVYELGSNYGLSVVRPLLWFVGGIFASAVLLLGVGVFGGAGGAGADLAVKWPDALLFSVRQTFVPFDALRAAPEALLKLAFNPGGAGWLRAWGVLLTLFEALAALLLVLAVRWRYRR